METILSIAGKPGLYKLVSRGNRNLIVEMLDESHKRMPAFATDRVTSLGDIAMYTDADEVPLWEVLDSVSKKEEGKVSSLSIAFLHLPYPCFVYLFHPHACLNLLGLRLDTH